MSVKIKILASGSAGNCYFVSDGTTRILIDAGLSRSRVEAELASIGEDPSALDAVLVTHAHADHASGVLGLVGAYQMPVYLTAGTRDVLAKTLLKACARTVVFEPDSELVSIGSILFFGITVPHDCAQPVAFEVVADNFRLAFVTDVGRITNHMSDSFRDVDFLLLESNHDVDGLHASPYPAWHKKRVHENHLSNDQVSCFIRDRLAPSVRHLVLGHLSSTNNDSRLAYAMAKQSLSQSNKAPNLAVIPPGGCSDVITL